VQDRALKEISDEFGHDFGDAALRHVSNILREVADRDGMVLGRVGGEEFALLLTNFPDADALMLAQILRMNIAERPVERHGMKMTITILCRE